MRLIEEAVVAKRDNKPVSTGRPSQQFMSFVPKEQIEPVAVLLSVLIDIPQVEALRATYDSLVNQSLPEWRWIIGVPSSMDNSRHNVNSFADARVSVTVVDDISEAFNSGLEAGLALKAKFAAYLQPGDLLELSVLEKAAWALYNLPQWELVQFWTVRPIGSDGANSVWKAGLSSGRLNYKKVNDYTYKA